MIQGVDYYPEHWDESRWQTDAAMIRRAGLTHVRIGEFAWALIEIADGVFDWGWLDRAVETLANAGLMLILCTPTAAPPPWLIQAHPHILPVDAEGRTRRPGTRRHYCANSAVYRQYSQRIASELARRYGEHPAVVGWQIDNEFGCYNTARCYCERCAVAFRQWLKARYATLEVLNVAWGAVFWGQVYRDWEQIQPPNLGVAEPNPSHLLDYYRFSSDSVVDYQQLQLDVLRRHSPRHFVTHNIMGTFTDLDYHDLARPLDFISWDSYPTGNAEMESANLFAPDETPGGDYAYDLGDPYVTAFCHDLARGLKQAPFWVMEQQSGNINWSKINTGVRRGALRLWSWHAMAAGAAGVVSFRWRACRFGHEQYHSGLLGHDGEPAPGYQDLLVLQDERAQMQQLGDQPYAPQVALFLDYPDLWAVKHQPHQQDFGYLRHLFAFHRALAMAGVGVDIVSPDADLARYRLILAPTLFMVAPALVERLEQMVLGGAHLLLGVRSGFKTPSNLVVEQPLPGVLRLLAGVRVRAWHALPPGVSYPLNSSLPDLSRAAHTWAEALAPDDESSDIMPLVQYRGGPFTGELALARREYGKGAVFSLGFYPDLAQARALVAYMLDELHIERLTELPQGVLHYRRGDRRLLLNFCENPHQVVLDGREMNVDGRDLMVVG